MKKTATTLLALALALGAIAQDNAAKPFSYLPNIHGAIRTRAELDTENGDYRFQVRNARVTLDGHIAPSIDYFIQTDLCDAGTMKILDAWGRFTIVKGLQFRAGQFRMPFGVETFRAPQNYIFANRSFMGKQIMNYRAVGVQANYTLPKTPLTIEAGAFNPATIGNHNIWKKTLAYATKLSYHAGEVTFTTGYASIRPYDIRANLIDAAIVWDNKTHWLVAGEYMFKKYCHKAAKSVHSWVGFVDWHTDVRAGVFNRWSVQLRQDGMTRHLAMDGESTEPARNRITLGSTLTYTYKAVHCDIRLDYEKYFWHSGYTAPVGGSDRLVAELVIRF